MRRGRLKGGLFCLPDPRYFTLCDVSDDSGELLRLGLSWGTSLPVVTAEPVLEPRARPVVPGSFAPGLLWVVTPALPETSAPAFAPPACASVSVGLIAMNDAAAIVVNFMICPFVRVGGNRTACQTFLRFGRGFFIWNSACRASFDEQRTNKRRS
jgi:hypothetical protein